MLHTLFLDERGAHNPPYDLEKHPFFARLSSKGAVTSTMHHPSEELLALMVKKQIISSLQLQLQGNSTSDSYVREGRGSKPARLRSRGPRVGSRVR